VAGVNATGTCGRTVWRRGGLLACKAPFQSGGRDGDDWLAVAAGVGVMAALTLGANEGQPEEAKTERAGEANPEQGGRPEDLAEKAASDGSSEAAYLDEVADIQNGSVEASLQSRRGGHAPDA
jgi:hypothetical protein